MREGELLGLKWADVDLERGTLRLRHTLVREGGKTVLGDLKTSKSRRSIRLTSIATDARRGRTRHLLPRSASYLRHPVAHTGHPSEARSRASGARHDSDDPGHLLALPAQHGRSDREGDGGCALLGQTRVAAPRPRIRSGVSVWPLRFSCKLRYFSGWACLDSNQGPLPYQRSALTG